MNLKDALYILKSNESMAYNEVRKSYLDLVSVWHPDRFDHSERLRQKAIEEMKQINVAWEVVKKSLKDQNKYSTSNEENYSSKNESIVLIKCIKCGTTNRIPECKSNFLKIKCGKCGESLRPDHSKASKDEPEDIFEEIRIYCGDQTCIGRIQPDGRCNQCGKKIEETEDIFEGIRTYCAIESCTGKIQPDGCCNQCGKTLKEGKAIEEKYRNLNSIKEKGILPNRIILLLCALSLVLIVLYFM